MDKTSPVYKAAEDFTKRWPDQEPQLGVAIGKRYMVATLEEFFKEFGDMFKVRYSKRRGYRGKLRDGRKVRLW